MSTEKIITITETQTTTSPCPTIISGTWPHPVTIEPNNFKYKSLSNFSCNTCIGCAHGCLFCYVPSTSVNKQAQQLAPLGVKDPDKQWGEYAFAREWDEKVFLASLKKAEVTPNEKLKPEGNRAIMFCTTCDPYQVIKHPDSKVAKKLNEEHRGMVRRALNLIRDKSTLNVRIMTRSPLAKKDFDLFKSFGNRLVFGMSIPTLNDDLARIYEPNAPAPSQRLKTLREAKAAGLDVYLAMAPTYPECDEADLRATLAAIKQLDPVTIFHEPINIRAENVDRIKEHADKLGVAVNTKVYSTSDRWRHYAVGSLMLVERIAGELGLTDRLHLWPDASLKSERNFEWYQKNSIQQKTDSRALTPTEKQRFEQDIAERYAEFKAWLSRWHERVSEWPGTKRDSTWQRPAPLTAQVLDPVLSPGMPQEDDIQLAACEDVIRKGWDTFVDVGRALITIRDQKLYRAKHGNFEAYAHEVWGMGKSHAYRLMEAAQVMDNLSPIGDKAPAQPCEAHVRELTCLKPADQVAAYQTAIQSASGGPVTAKLVREAVKPFKARQQEEGAPSPIKSEPTKTQELVEEHKPIANVVSADPKVAMTSAAHQRALDATADIFAFFRSAEAKALTEKDRVEWKKIAALIVDAVARVTGS